MEEEGEKCFIAIAAESSLGRRVSQELRALALEGAQSNKHLFREPCLQDDLTDDYAKSDMKGPFVDARVHHVLVTSLAQLHPPGLQY